MGAVAPNGAAGSQFVQQVMPGGEGTQSSFSSIVTQSFACLLSSYKCFTEPGMQALLIASFIG